METKEVENKYAILQETNEDQCESWLYFIKYNGNEENLNYLNDQINSVRCHLLEGMSTFDIEIKTLVSENTAKDMCRVELNHYTYHRKFDGVLQKINFKLKKKHSNEKKICKIFDRLGYGGIENFIDGEEIFHPRTESDVSSEENNSGSDNESENNSDDEPESEVASDSDEKKEVLKNKKLPNNLKISK
jgi:hypothetical protein